MGKPLPTFRKAPPNLPVEVRRRRVRG